MLFAFPRVVNVASAQNSNRLFRFFFFSLKVIIGPFDGLLISGKLKVGLAYLVLSHCHLVLEPVTSSYVFIYLLTVLKVAVSS